MKNIKNFGDFINESYNSNSTRIDIEKIFKKHGFEEIRSYGSSISASLDNSEGSTVNELTDDAKRAVGDIVKYSKTGNVLLLQTALGYQSGNDISVKIADRPAKPRKIYHMTNESNVKSILKNGLSATEASGHSDTFGTGVTGKNIKEQLYRAVFGVSGKGPAKKLPQYFKFNNPVLLEINAKPYQWYDDPLMPPDMKSVLTFDDIKAEDISLV